MDIKYFKLATFYSLVAYLFMNFLYSGQYFPEFTIIFITALIVIWGSYFILREK